MPADPVLLGELDLAQVLTRCELAAPEPPNRAEPPIASV